MADDFVNFRMMQGFDHKMPLAEAYRWQDEMVEIMRPTMGAVVGYKTGGHDPGPGFATFPPEGIRAYILEGMLREDGRSESLGEAGCRPRSTLVVALRAHGRERSCS